MFKKFAKVPVIAVAEAQFSTDSKRLAFKRLADKRTASYYAANASKIDVQSMLNIVSKEYDISDNPQDYIFEAVRAVTAEVPNENGDAFPRNELLRFDHRLGKQVYQTFVLKPHHINHRADNPKTSRGLVLDASYNNLSPAMEKCAECNFPTDTPEGRDATGVNCAKCGSVVKDEFVELLLAIDTRKDPTFADGVKTGSLDSLSMGCEAGYTDCSICDNRARSVQQFCSHIKSGNKKKKFKTASGTKMSFEKCGEVVFTEISRVDQPADPTAKQRELLQIPMSTESELLVMASRLAKLETVVAQQMPAPGAPPAQPGHEEPHDEAAAPTPQEACAALEQLVMELQSKPEAQAELALWTKVLDMMKGMCSEEKEHTAQMGEASPQVPFKTLAESMKWAESSIYKLKAENHRLASEKEARFKDAAASGRPVLAWENASYTAQIKTNDQYIERLGNYIAKARELEASGAPWGKDITRSMSRFFATKQAQAINDIMEELEEVSNNDPQMAPMVEMVKMVVEPGDGVPSATPLNDYLQEREESEDQHITSEEMGVKDEEFGAKLPGAMASKVIEKLIASDLDDIMGSVKENQVGTSKELKFAGIYKDIQVSVTKVGNVRVSTPQGNLFVVRPAEKPADEKAAAKLAREVLSHIAEHGLTETVLKYDAVIGPKMAQVLEHHIEDFAGGRDDGDKKSITEDGEGDGQLQAREKPEDSLVGEEHTDRKDEVREQRDQSNADVLEKHQPDHKDALPKGIKPITDSEDSDMADKREKPSKSTQKEVAVDFKDKKPKKSAEWEKPWEKKDKEDGEKDSDKKDKKDKSEKKDAQMAAPPAAPMAPAGPGPGPQMAAPGEAMCAAGDMCVDPACMEHGKMAQGDMGMGAPPAGGAPGAGAAPGGAAPGMPMMGNIEDPLVKAATIKHAGRLERLYKTRLDKVSSDGAKKLAEVEKKAVEKAVAKLARAMKLAAKRQELNLEYSPLKAGMLDVLATEQDIDADSFYPGMDNFTASRLVEATASQAFTEFTDSLVTRAAEFLKMSDEALTAIEADVKNLQPAPIQVQASAAAKPATKMGLREAAVKGNFTVAPTATDETISSGGNRDNIRSALNTTKVRRTSQSLKR